MIEALRLRGLGAISEADLAFRPGFTAITGETGAGKTMLLTALGLLLGGRADAGAMGAAAARIDVEGEFTVDVEGPAASRVAEAGGALEKNVLIVSRTVGRDGRSRAFAGGRTVPASALAELAAELVTIHGQADQRGLLRASVQRSALDRFAGAAIGAALRSYQVSFDELRGLDQELAVLIGERSERAREAEELRTGLIEVQAAAPKPGEDRQLRSLTARLAHVDALRLAATLALEQLRDDDLGGAPTAMSRLASARAGLEAVAGHDPGLDELTRRCVEAGYLVGELTVDLASYLDSLDADPAALESATARLATLRELTRKHASDVDGVIAWAGEAERRLADLSDGGGRIDQLRERRQATYSSLVAAAGVLTAARRSAGAALGTAVTAELNGLAMAGAELEVDCRHRPDVRGLDLGTETVAFARHGVDEIEFMLRAHPGAPRRPLSKGASGGELSRVMLALEVVLAGATPGATFVFDEVDAGVGGRAAVEIGRRLAGLARSSQVIVVTHLPQVAAFATQHMVVRKTSDSASTSTAVFEVVADERLEELSRMLGGLADSELGRGHAAELLDLAASERAVG